MSKLNKTKILEINGLQGNNGKKKCKANWKKSKPYQ